MGQRGELKEKRVSEVIKQYLDLADVLCIRVYDGRKYLLFCPLWFYLYIYTCAAYPKWHLYELIPMNFLKYLICYALRFLKQKKCTVQLLMSFGSSIFRTFSGPCCPSLTFIYLLISLQTFDQVRVTCPAALFSVKNNGRKNKQDPSLCSVLAVWGRLC